jgi:hypothetical protein
MKKIISFSWLSGHMGIALCSMLFAFTSLPGGHSVQVYLDSKLMIDQYVNSKTDVPKLTLDPGDNYNKLIVKYSECGRTVTGRKITLKDANNKILRDWRFEGSSTGFQKSMECPVKDILTLKQKGSNTLKLFYSSNEFRDGQQIASLVIGGSAATASK